jgi:hypothetical protein
MKEIKAQDSSVTQQLQVFLEYCVCVWKYLHSNADRGVMVMGRMGGSVRYHWGSLYPYFITLPLLTLRAANPWVAVPQILDFSKREKSQRHGEPRDTF